MIVTRSTRVPTEAERLHFWQMRYSTFQMRKIMREILDEFSREIRKDKHPNIIRAIWRKLRKP